jgi:hypothetical protein
VILSDVGRRFLAFGIPQRYELGHQAGYHLKKRIERLLADVYSTVADQK